MKKYVIAGASGRAYYLFAKSLKEGFSDCAQVTGIFDPNPLRAEKFKEIDPDYRIYTDFDLMIEQEKPDAVIVTTVDRYHHEYVIRALEAGCDAISEKPLTIDAEKCKMIFDAQERTGKKVIVTFNFRFMPYVTKVKEFLMNNSIGKILSVNLEYLLGKPHGSDYMRRWHAEMQNSSGMLVHKSTHHFDLVNWLIDDEPETVSAQGSLDFYGKNGKQLGKTCRTCPGKKECEFYFDIAEHPLNRTLYLECEEGDGYLRDRCVFDPRINIYDNMSVSVRYRKGALLTYGLNLFNPYEGYKLNIIGEKGRIEAYDFMTGLNAPRQTTRTFDVIYSENEKQTVEFTEAKGSHGGGDAKMLEMLFRGGIPDTYHQFPTAYDGAKSIMIGIAANESIRTGKKVDVSEFLDSLKK